MDIIIILIIISTTLMISSLVLYIINQNIKKRRQSIIDYLSQLGQLKPANHSSYDYLFTYKNKTYKVKIAHIGFYKELSINSKKHWQLKPSKKIKLISTHGFDEIEGDKMLIVYPHPSKMVKYINENEIVFILPNELCFDFYVYSDQQLKYIKDL